MKNVQKGGKVVFENGKWKGENASGCVDAELFNFLSLSGRDLLFDADTAEVIEGNKSSEAKYEKIRNNSVYFRLWKYPLENEGLINSEMWTEENIHTILELLDNIINVRIDDMDQAKRRVGRNIIKYNKRTQNHINLLASIIQLRTLINSNNRVDIHNIEYNGDDVYDHDGFNIELTPGFQDLKTRLEASYIIAEPSSLEAAARENTLGAAEQRGGTKRKKMTKKKKKSKTKKKAKKKKKKKKNY